MLILLKRASLYAFYYFSFKPYCIGNVEVEYFFFFIFDKKKCAESLHRGAAVSRPP